MHHIGAVALSRNDAAFGQGTGARVLTSIQCQGTEALLTSCRVSIPSVTSSSQDVGVRCQPG